MLQYSVRCIAELGLVLCHNVVQHLDPWLPSCSFAFSFPFPNCSYEWTASEYMTDPVSVFPRLVQQRALFPDHQQYLFIRLVFCPVDLFRLSPDPHLQCFQPFNVVASENPCLWCIQGHACWRPKCSPFVSWVHLTAFLWVIHLFYWMFLSPLQFFSEFVLTFEQHTFSVTMLPK